VSIERKNKVGDAQRLLLESTELGCKLQSLCSTLMDLASVAIKENSKNDGHILIESLLLKDDEVVLGLLK